MNDTTLTALFDDVAASITPRPDFEAVITGIPSGTIPSGGLGPERSFRLPIGIAAATVALLGGSVAAYQLRTSADSVATADGELVTPSPFPPIQRNPSDQHDASRPASDASTAGPAGETTPTADTTAPGAPGSGESGSLAGAPAAGDTKPPVAVVRTARLGRGDLGATPLRQKLYGTAAPSEKVTITTAFGTTVAQADRHGEWLGVLELVEVPGGTTIDVTVTFAGGPELFTFQLVRPADTTIPPATTIAPETTKPVETTVPKTEPAPTTTQPKSETTVAPKPIAFTADLGSADLVSSPMKQFFYGTGTPGSVVRAESDFGSAEAVVGEKGYWELKLKMYEVPVGTTVTVEVFSAASGEVFRFSLTRQAPPEIAFTANAAFTECDSNPPFNEYWGKATPGATISINSAYGSGQVTANGDGKWSARIEFPEAPFGEPFGVVVSSSSSNSVYEFSMVRVG